mmetsp:Transcript_17926/g.25294  ORF Transcript_17926/g.25294 Transcript_17926/m.25294 type:complete len:226 (-) Transcript_17926:604-1281(-)
MDRIRNPQDRLTLTLDSTDKSRQIGTDLLSTHTDNNGKTSRDVLGVHGINNIDKFIRCAFVTNFDSQWVTNTTAKFKMSRVQITSTFSNPEHVGRTIVPTSSGRILTGQGLFVRQQKTFVGSVKVSLGKGGGGSVNTNSLHETERFINLGSKFTVPGTFISLLDEIQVPSVETTDISVTTSREGSQNIKSLSRLVVGFHHIAGVISPSFGSEFFRIDDITSVTGK